jgi:biotin-dependent carboxylase-like uncharacterized protein
MIEILTSGSMNSVQDLGRPGYLDQGIGRGGAMDRPALRIANMMAGNDEGAAALEIAVFPFRMRFVEPASFAVTGAACRASLNGDPSPPWWAGKASAGDELRLDAPLEGSRAYVAVGGGIDVPCILQSRATDLKSVFGGQEGRALQRGDRLATGRSARDVQDGSIDPYHFRECLGGVARGEPLVLRFMPGAEFEAFDDDARGALLDRTFSVTADNNRQGMRLEGPRLALTNTLELLSHGIMPGTIQVPPSGQAVIQLAEANTCGGYPKIGHVIEADLWRLGQAPSGATIQFEIISRNAAIAAERDAETRMKRLANLLAGRSDRKA